MYLYFSVAQKHQIWMFYFIYLEVSLGLKAVLLFISNSLGVIILSEIKISGSHLLSLALVQPEH